jgi:ATP/maltotriose-dependent transcriptional regulator MalT
MPDTDPHAPLTDRAPHLRRLDRLVAGLRVGRGGAVAVTGEAGVGKTALLARLMTRAPGVTVLAAAGVADEAALPYAALGDLLRPLRERLPSLPAPQARALGAALALSPGEHNPYAICLATLTLLASASPVLVVVDDVDLLDSPSATALFYTARRIAGEPVAMVFAARERPVAPGIEELPLDRPAGPLDGLTERETQVVRAIAGGLSNPEAATALRVSRKTVETHLSSAYRKLGVHTRTQLVRQIVGILPAEGVPRGEPGRAAARWRLRETGEKP